MNLNKITAINNYFNKLFIFAQTDKQVKTLDEFKSATPYIDMESVHFTTGEEDIPSNFKNYNIPSNEPINRLRDRIITAIRYKGKIYYEPKQNFGPHYRYPTHSELLFRLMAKTGVQKSNMTDFAAFFNYTESGFYDPVTKVFYQQDPRISYFFYLRDLQMKGIDLPDYAMETYKKLKRLFANKNKHLVKNSSHINWFR